MSTTTPAPTEPSLPQITPPVKTASLNGRKPQAIHIEVDADASAEIARSLEFSALRKFRFEGALSPIGREDWQLSGMLGATIVQPCSVSLAPVTTRIDERLSRLFIAQWSEPDAEEIEMTRDETHEPLGTQIDLSALLIEALALAAPDFPRARDVEMAPKGVLRAAPEGDSPLDDDAIKPFASLAALRDKLDRG